MSPEPTRHPRVAPARAVDSPNATTLRALMGGRQPLLLFRVLARSPKVLTRFLRGGLLDTDHLSVREREVVITRTLAWTRAHYEWGVHAAEFSTAAALSAGELSDLADTQAPLSSVWPAHERALAVLCDALSSTGDVDDATWQLVSSRLSDEALLEAIYLNGYYTTVSRIVKTLRLPQEPGTSRIATPLGGGGTIRPAQRGSDVPGSTSPVS